MANTKPALIVGNGISRRNINLETCVDKFDIYGCNALYREFHAWNYLIAIDDGMIDELRRYHNNVGEIIIPDEDERYEDAKFSPYRKRSNAGMNAMHEAIKRHHKTLYCIGFDFILKGDIATDNIYKNTENYGPETHTSANDNLCRMNYLYWFMCKHSDVHFIFVVPDEGIKAVSPRFNDILLDNADSNMPAQIDLIAVKSFTKKVENA